MARGKGRVDVKKLDPKKDLSGDYEGGSTCQVFRVCLINELEIPAPPLRGGVCYPKPT